MRRLQCSFLGRFWDSGQHTPGKQEVKKNEKILVVKFDSLGKGQKFEF